jgi:hypothetical protein
MNFCGLLLFSRFSSVMFVEFVKCLIELCYLRILKVFLILFLGFSYIRLFISVMW